MPPCICTRARQAQKLRRGCLEEFRSEVKEADRDILGTRRHSLKVNSRRATPYLKSPKNTEQNTRFPACAPVLDQTHKNRAKI